MSASERDHVAKLQQWAARRLPGRAWRRTRFPALVRFFADLISCSTIVTVTGTNGKGSVCAMLEAALLADGKRPGVFTSPHLCRVTERIRISGLDVTPEELEFHAAALWPRVLEFVQRHGPDHLPSFFEILILLAFSSFRRAGVDTAVLEAGIGGYHDATSMLPATMGIVTSVALDHERELGETPEAIAADKAGIAPDGSVLVLGPEITGACLAAIERDAAQRGVRVHRADRDRLDARWCGLRGHDVSLAGGDGRMNLSGCAGTVRVAGAESSKPQRGGTRVGDSAGASKTQPQPPRPPSITNSYRIEFRLPLAGSFQVDNLATVVAAIETLCALGRVADASCLRGVSHTRWPGRLEYIETEPAWLLDGAHNAHAFDALTATVRRELSHEDVVVLYGASDGHDYRQCLPKLSAAAAQIYLVDGFCRAVPTGELERLSRGQFLVAGTFPSPQTAVESLSQQRLPRGKTILVCGSLFLVGECRDCLRNRRLIRE